MPTERLENGAWPHPGRLPLGAGWSGHCTAPGCEGEVPERETLEQGCNLGYAGSCSRLPPERAWDAVRFAVTAQEAGGELQPRSGLIQLQYVCERAHRPVDHGRLTFDAGEACWLQRHPDVRVQRMAECFLEARQARRKVVDSVVT